LAGVTVQEIPVTDAAQPTAVPVMLVPLSMLVCYDGVYANKSCDVDEGISGVTVYVADGRSGAVLGQALTDQGGRAAVTIRVEETAELIISVPSFAATQKVQARQPRIQPLVVKTVAPLPALLP
jgi:hypothetical protein